MRGMRKHFPAAALLFALLSVFISLGGVSAATSGIHALTAKKAANADKVDSYHASRKPKPLTLLTLDKNAKIPLAALPAGLQGPKGDTGAQGAQGPQGIQGVKGDPGTGNTCTAGQSQSNPAPGAALAEYTSWSTIASCSITLPAQHQVLIVGQFTAQNTHNEGDVLARVLVDGALADGGYWSNIGSTSPGAGSARVTMPVSHVVTMAAGTHTVALQGSYWNGGTDETINPYSNAINVVDLG